MKFEKGKRPTTTTTATTTDNEIHHSQNVVKYRRRRKERSYTRVTRPTRTAADSSDVIMSGESKNQKSNNSFDFLAFDSCFLSFVIVDGINCLCVHLSLGDIKSPGIV
jgi:hypothetical protein